MKNEESITTIYINSKDIQSGNSSNFNYMLPIGISNATAYYVKQVSIPYSDYTTFAYPMPGFSALNFALTDTGGTHIGTFPTGNYSAFAAGVILQNELNSASSSSNYSVTYNANTYTYTIETLDSTVFSLIWGSGQYPGQQVYYTFGFTGNLSGHSIYFSPNVASASGQSYNYYIKSSALTLNGSYSYFGGQKDNVIAAVPINASPGGLIQYNNQVNDWIPLRNINLTNIDIQLVDDFNNPINLLGLNWTMTIVIRNKSF